MMPDALLRAVGLDRDILLLRVSKGRFDVTLRSGGHSERLASSAFGDSDRADPDASLRAVLAGLEPEGYRVVLSLDAAMAVRRTLRVPRAAEAELMGVLAFEIERHTPFRADEVYFNPTVDRATNGGKTLSVDMLIVPRRIVDPLTAGLRTLGFGPDAVIVADSGDVLVDAANRLPVHGVHERRGRPGAALKLLATLTLALALAAATTPLIRLKSLADDLAVTVQQTKIEADATLALQDEVDRLTRSARIVFRAKSQAASPLNVLQALSELLPDGTWVMQLNLTGRDVVVEGRTDSSADLVGRLEASAVFESVKYLAPITRDAAAAGAERFIFSLRLAES